MRVLPDPTTRLVIGLSAAVVLGFAGSLALAQDAESGDASRQTFNAEICKVDGLTASQCDCAWTFVSGKLSAGDLRLAMILVASSSRDADTAKKADQALDKSSANDKRKDALASETGALVIEAEDACEKK